MPIEGIDDFKAALSVRGDTPTTMNDAIVRIKNALRVIGNKNNRLYSSAIKEATKQLYDKIQSRFDEQRGTDGRYWAKWKESTAKIRKAEGIKTKLQHTGKMRESLYLKRKWDSSYQIGFNEWYEIYHETGRTDMQPRRLLTIDGTKLSKTDENLIYTVCNQIISDAISQG